MTPEQVAKLETALREVFEEDGLVSDWAVVVELVEDDETALHHWASVNAAGWKAHGMALYLAAAHAPEPSYLRHQGHD